MDKIYNVKYVCNNCKEPVPEEHFTSADGRILCAKCSVGVEPCSKKIKNIIDEVKEGK